MKMSNLVLIGFMGTGKSTIGRKAARRLGLQFIDTDHEIERVTGMTVPELFKKHGEIRFRSEEKAAVKRITQNDNQVIATGGGVVLNRENIETLRQNGIIICLTATADTIYQRVKGKKNRPLLQTENPLETINNLLSERKPFYETADGIVETSDKEVEDVANEVVRLYTELRKKK